MAYFIICLTAGGTHEHALQPPLGNSPSKIIDFTRLVIQMERQPQNPWERPKHKKLDIRSLCLAKAARFPMPGKSSISKHRNFSVEYQQGGYGTVEAMEPLKDLPPAFTHKHRVLHINWERLQWKCLHFNTSLLGEWSSLSLRSKRRALTSSGLQKKTHTKPTHNSKWSELQKSSQGKQEETEWINQIILQKQD